MTVPRRSRDGGFVAIELTAGIALLLLPVAAVVFTLPIWSERQSGARAIAREVARETARAGVCDAGSGTDLAVTMARNLGVPPGDVAVTIECRPGSVLDPGSDVEVAVAIVMPALHLPGLGDVASWTWTGRHREPVDTYGGLP